MGLCPPKAGAEHPAAGAGRGQNLPNAGGMEGGVEPGVSPPPSVSSLPGSGYPLGRVDGCLHGCHGNGAGLRGDGDGSLATRGVCVGCVCMCVCVVPPPYTPRGRADGWGGGKEMPRPSKEPPPWAIRAPTQGCWGETEAWPEAGTQYGDSRPLATTWGTRWGWHWAQQGAGCHPGHPSTPVPRPRCWCQEQHRAVTQQLGNAVASSWHWSGVSPGHALQPEGLEGRWPGPAVARWATNRPQSPSWQPAAALGGGSRPTSPPGARGPWGHEDLHDHHCGAATHPKAKPSPVSPVPDATQTPGTVQRWFIERVSSRGGRCRRR